MQASAGNCSRSVTRRRHSATAGQVPSPGWEARYDWARSTMAHLCSVYPFHADASFGERGVLMGANVTAGMGGFYFDPFEFYAQGHLTNPNMIVMGSVGFGKSATVKALGTTVNAVKRAAAAGVVLVPRARPSLRACA